MIHYCTIDGRNLVVVAGFEYDCALERGLVSTESDDRRQSIGTTQHNCAFNCCSRLPLYPHKIQRLMAKASAKKAAAGTYLLVWVRWKHIQLLDTVIGAHVPSLSMASFRDTILPLDSFSFRCIHIYMYMSNYGSYSYGFLMTRSTNSTRGNGGLLQTIFTWYQCRLSHPSNIPFDKNNKWQWFLETMARSAVYVGLAILLVHWNFGRCHQSQK